MLLHAAEKVAAGTVGCGEPDSSSQPTAYFWRRVSTGAVDYCAAFILPVALLFYAVPDTSMFWAATVCRVLFSICWIFPYAADLPPENESKLNASLGRF